MSTHEQPLQTPGDIERQEAIERATEVLMATAPELMTGNLPDALQARFTQMFGPNKEYALGVNQSRGMEDVEGAEKELAAWGGISMNGGGTSFGRRFIIFDSGSEEQGFAQWLAGYYGPSMGRLVTVFPVNNEDGYAPRAQVNELEDEALPQDFLIIRTGSDGTADMTVAAKYVAGFIDDAGFHANQHFLADDSPPKLERAE